LRIKNTISVLVLSLFLYVGYAFSQQASPYAVDPNSDQGKDLTIAQLKLQNAAYQLQTAQQNYFNSRDAFATTGKKVCDSGIAKNKWPATVEFDINSGTCVDHPKPAENKPEDKK